MIQFYYFFYLTLVHGISHGDTYRIRFKRSSNSRLCLSLLQIFV